MHVHSVCWMRALQFRYPPHGLGLYAHVTVTGLQAGYPFPITAAVLQGSLSA